ncbi:DUF72 domain-containing protein [Lentiprolixibacter aurantiacus]|uniref:DUF72 domain-containing protein n=1 Tax=Lentiprolixibacter aurantiacus TaxID=2993939 RepID=A0AAE3SNB4_9FLAO|nr:DUF72 domain-containing protein [Lentiprolixibacter aurantiacus]MCX2719577.1 DUF72 domain-containing protein [Lentiprolixibacter aurantiacus]
MKFGKVEHPELIDFTLPPDHSGTTVLLEHLKPQDPLIIHVGAAKWSRQALKNFYPKGTREELVYYASQFNSIELNATFYRIFPSEQYDTWYRSVPDNFRFFPKVVQNVSHLRRLNDMAYPVLENFLLATAGFQDKLGTLFLQMHPNFSPKNWDRVVRFVEYWPKEFPLALEFRHSDWYKDVKVSGELFHLLAAHRVANILTDTPGRRDMLHMRLTNDEAFIRFVAANHSCDYDRIDDWVARIRLWHKQGLRKVNFFVHQQMTSDDPLLASYLIDKLNKGLGLHLHVPKTLAKSK